VELLLGDGVEGNRGVCAKDLSGFRARQYKTVVTRNNTASKWRVTLFIVVESQFGSSAGEAAARAEARSVSNVDSFNPA
jgi:hypothetical protein